MGDFLGLTVNVFTAYTKEKWASNVYNLPRMRNKDLLLQVCDIAQRGVQGALGDLTRAASDEVPNILNNKKVDSQWVYWYRDASSRQSLASFLEKTPLDQSTFLNLAPQDKHLNIAVILRETELWIGLHAASGALVDRRNLASKCSHSWEREHFLELLAGLPTDTDKLGHAQIGFTDRLLDIQAYQQSQLLSDTEQLLTHNMAWQIGFALSAQNVIELAGDLPQHLGLWLEALLPLYRFIAWTQNNDFIEAKKQIQEQKSQKRRQATTFNNGDKVRIIAGPFVGKTAVVQDITKNRVTVLVDNKLSVVVTSLDLATI